MTSENNEDDMISLEEQIQVIVDGTFTEEGPHFNEDMKTFLDEMVKGAIAKADSKDSENVGRWVMACGAINSSVVGLIDDFGVEAIADLLEAMSKKYREYLETAESLH